MKGEEMQINGTGPKAKFEIDPSVLFKITPTLLATTNTKHQFRMDYLRTWYDRELTLEQREGCQAFVLGQRMSDRERQYAYEGGRINDEQFLNEEQEDLQLLARNMPEWFSFVDGLPLTDQLDFALALRDLMDEILHVSPS